MGFGNITAMNEDGRTSYIIEGATSENRFNEGKKDVKIEAGASGDIFKIKPLDDNASKVVVDGHKTVSPFNSAKHLKTANIPALCDQCVYRSIDEGGNGKCPKYEKGAMCAIRKDFVELINQLDTRNPEHVKTMLDMLAKL